MAADPRDDFSGFAGREHMFFGLADPYGMIREELENGLRKQVADTVVESIVMQGEPLFLTLGRKTEVENEVIVAHFAFCLRATVTVGFDAGRRRETMPMALTFMFGRVDQHGQEQSRTHFDLHADADRGYDEGEFQRRFMAFRAEL